MFGMGIFALKREVNENKDTIDDITISETVTEVSDTFTCNINNSVAKNFKITISNTDAKTIALCNIPIETNITIGVTASANAAITWPWAAADWNEGAAPTILSTYFYEVLAFTKDRGTNWFAAVTDGWDIS